MKILDLTDSFISCVLQRSDRDAYEATYPVLFDHYFRYWCPRSYNFVRISEAEVRDRVSRVAEVSERLAAMLESKRFELSGMQLVVFVGGNTSNGHAFRDGATMVVWIPVESYISELRAEVFVAHELFHSLHYQHSPDFEFTNEPAKNHFGRQLITEGMASYLTAELLGVPDLTALWADYLMEQEGVRWMSECRARLPELIGFCRRHFNDSDPNTEFFMANHPENILEYRAGYFVGLNLVREIARREHLGPVELLKLPRSAFEDLILGLL